MASLLVTSVFISLILKALKHRSHESHWIPLSSTLHLQYIWEDMTCISPAELLSHLWQNILEHVFFLWKERQHLLIQSTDVCYHISELLLILHTSCLAYGMRHNLIQTAIKKNQADSVFYYSLKNVCNTSFKPILYNGLDFFLMIFHI